MPLAPFPGPQQYNPLAPWHSPLGESLYRTCEEQPQEEELDDETED